MRWVRCAAASLATLVLSWSTLGCMQSTGVAFVPFGLGDFSSSTGSTGGTGGGGSNNATAGEFVPGGISNTGAAGVANALAAQYPTCRTVPNADVWRGEVLALVNDERQSAGLQPLRRNPTLEAQAETYACEMIHFDFFGHENPETGSTLRIRNTEFGYAFSLIGENLAAGQRTPQEAMDSWMNSAGHRANILQEDFQEIGIGLRSGGDYGMYWVQEFGRPAPIPVAIDDSQIGPARRG